jgi:3-oxoacyl-[acyl-carrier protein] reductase
MSNLLNLNGKIAVITGATRGIGLSIAETLAKHGATLVLNAKSDESRIADHARRLAFEFGIVCEVVMGDMSDPETADALAKKAFSMGRRLDIFVNNAGILQDGLIGMIPAKDIDLVIDVNLKGVLHGTQAAARVMRRSGSGSIINLSSIIGRYGNRGQLVYGASKAGVIGATMSAAKELAPFNIRVNAIAPGFIKTDMTAQLTAEKFDERLESIAMKRIGYPEDVANCALFLASDQSSYITGQIVGVDGGMLI